jgi:predicted NBD/HSP70 family sugar kinase
VYEADCISIGAFQKPNTFSKTYLITVINYYRVGFIREKYMVTFTRGGFAMTPEVRNKVDLGRTNRRAVLAEVVLNGPMPRKEIAQTTSLTNAAISRITRDLIDAGLLLELPDGARERKETQQKKPGRRLVQLDVNSKGGYVLGIGVNVFSQSVTLSDLKNQRIARRDLKLSDLTNPDYVIDQLIREANAMITEHVPDRRRLLGAGISISATVNPSAGRVEASHYLGWPAVPLGQKLSDALGIPIYVENQPNAQALAETRFGSAKGIKDLLVLNANLGICGSLLLDGHITRGQNYQAGMIGTMAAPSGSTLTLDEMAGGVSIIRRLHGEGAETSNMPSGELAKRLGSAIASALKGDAHTLEAMAEAGRVLGESVSQLVGFIQPDAVMVTGTLAAISAYTNGCRNAIHANAGNHLTQVLAGTMTAQAAARWVAIDVFLIKRDLNFSDFKLSTTA